MQYIDPINDVGCYEFNILLKRREIRLNNYITGLTAYLDEFYAYAYMDSYRGAIDSDFSNKIDHHIDCYVDSTDTKDQALSVSWLYTQDHAAASCFDDAKSGSNDC